VIDLENGEYGLPREAYQPRRLTEFIAIHCSDTFAHQDIGVKEIRRWHQAEPRFWLDCGYHFVIRRDGSIEYGRPLNTVGAHVEGYNRLSVGICLVGGKGRDGHADNNFTGSQWQTLTLLVNDLHRKYPRAIVRGHRDFPGVKKQCPSFDAKAWWAGVRESHD
jgi:hypothetical protein